MAVSFRKRLSMREKGLRYHLLVVEFLVAVLPFLSLFYLFYREHFFLETSQMLLIALTLALILSGLIILRQIFDRFSVFATSLQEAKQGKKALITVQRDTAELQEITDSLNTLMNRLEQTTAQLQSRTLELLAIRELTEVASKSLDMDDLLTMLLEKSMHVTKAQIGSVLMVESEKNRFRVVAATGSQPGPERGSYIPIDDTMLAEVVSERASLLVQDIETDPRTRKVNEPKYGAPSFLSVPIFAGGTLLGILNLSCKETHQLFDSHEEDIVSIMVGEIGFALDNARLHSQVLEHVKDLQERTLELTKANNQLQEQIAQRKHIEQHLEDTNKFLHNILDSSSSISIISTDLEQNVLFWNKGAENIFGYRAEEIVGSHKINILYPDDDVKQQAHEIGSLITREKRNVHRELREITKDGRMLWVNLNLTPTFDERGNVIGILGIGEDITERKQAEESLKESEERYRILSEESPLGISLIDQQGRYKYLNRKFSEIFGYTYEDIPTGREWFRKTYPNREYRHQVISTWINDQRDYGVGESRPRTFTVTCKSGEEKTIHFKPVTMKSGDQLVIHEDVTERQRLEAQLQRAQIMETLGTLAGGVAHDLNNILSGLVSYPDLLLIQLPEESPLTKPIVTIQNSGKKAAAIVQDLLTLARRGVATMEVVDLNEIITEYLESPECEKLRSFHPHVAIEPDLKGDLLNISGSRVHLTKTVMNLISNAAEAMREGGRIMVSTENRYIDRPIKGYDQLKEGDYVILSVADTGVGIPAEDLDRVFEPFYSKKKMGRSGTGLGMAVVWGTVKDHKGYIDIESTEGKGTTFSLYFPATRKGQATGKPPVPVEDYRGTGESILVVDDVKEQREIASTILSELGYSVSAVSSGQEAVEYLRGHAADLLILDMIMEPGIDGLDTYKRVLELYPHQRAIIASGFSETDRVKEARKLGAGPYIRKPYTMEKIGIAVREELDK
jgi:PAS domain S-box-containing protein